MKPTHKHALQKNSRMARTSKTDTAAVWATDFFKSLLITFAAGAIYLLCFSLLAYFYKNPNSLLRPFGILASGLTALTGGFASTRIHGQGALLCGLLNGSATMAVLILLSCFLRSYAAGYGMGISLLLHTGFLALSVTGAYLGLCKKPKRKRKF